MRIELGEAALFVDIDGAGVVPDGDTMSQRPTVVLLHGGPGFDHGLFKPDFSRLMSVAQVVYVDQRGHGRSDRSDSASWNRDTWADDVRRLCDALGIERPIVYGHSYGGVVAQAYASRHPEHPGGVILQSTTARFDLERSREGFRQNGDNEAAETFERFWGRGDVSAQMDFVQRCLPLYGPWTPGPAEMGRAIINLDLLAQAPQHFRGLDLRQELASVRCPALVLAGDDDPLMQPADAEELARSLPTGRSRLEVIERAGHFIWRDRPDVFWPLVEAFVTEAYDATC